MPLPFELTTLPDQALDILRYIGRTQLDTADADALMTGVGMSERSFSKAIRRLVTRNYMAMNEGRTYRLTHKGHQAIEAIAAYDAEAPDQQAVSRFPTVTYDLCAVLPAMLPESLATSWYLGIEPLGLEQVIEPTQVIFRIKASQAEVSPAEITLTVSAEQPAQASALTITPAPGQTQLRIEIEAFQPLDLDELFVAGGMYFYVTVGQSLSELQALHSVLAIAQP